MEMKISKVKIDDLSFQQAMLDIKNGKMRIPDFQREFVWERNQIISLLDSIYRHYPIGSLLLWNTNEDIQSFRSIGNITLKNEKEGLVHYVLDGQQRLTSLYASLERAEIKVIVNGKIVKKKLEIYFDLDNEVFVADPFDIIKPDKIYTAKGLQKIEGYRDYYIFFDKLFSKINELQGDFNSVASWVSSDLSVSLNAAIKKLNNFNHCGFIERKNNKVEFGKNFNVIKEKNPLDLIKVLATYFLWFKELLVQFLETPVMGVEELLKKINLNCEEKIKKFQIRRRLSWIYCLGIGNYNEKVFSLKDGDKSKIENVIRLFEIESQKREDNNKQLRQRYFSIKQITSSSILKLAQGLTKDRVDSLDKVITRFQNYPFSVIYVLEQPVDIACEIFERINNSGKILNIVDLMVAKTYSTTFNLRNRIYDFQQELKKQNYASIPDITIIQCLSAIKFKYLNRKNILSLQTEDIENIWEGVLESIRKAIDFLKSNFEITNSRVLPYNSIIIPLSYYFYHKKGNIPEFGTEETISKWFWKVSISRRYDSSLETKIAEDIKEIDKILIGEKAEFRYDMIPITTEKIINQKLNLGSAFCKAILCLYINNGSREFINNAKVNLNSFSKFNSAELHHIFPKNYLKKHQPNHYHQKDSIVNIALASAALNKNYSSRAPSDYIAECADINPDINLTMKSHYIKDFKKSGLMNDDFKMFLANRANNILTEIKKNLGDLSPIEVEFSTDEKSVIEKFEKAIRDFIENILIVKEVDYWDNLDSGFRRKIEERLNDWIRKNPYQNAHEHRLIDFCQIMEYFNIIKANWNHFEPVIKSKSELKKHFENINNFRNGFMHSRKVDLATKKLAEASFIWFGNIIPNDY